MIDELGQPSGIHCHGKTDQWKCEQRSFPIKTSFLTSPVPFVGIASFPVDNFVIFLCQSCSTKNLLSQSIQHILQFQNNFEDEKNFVKGLTKCVQLPLLMVIYSYMPLHWSYITSMQCPFPSWFYDCVEPILKVTCHKVCILTYVVFTMSVKQSKVATCSAPYQLPYYTVYTCVGYLTKITPLLNYPVLQSQSRICPRDISLANQRGELAPTCKFNKSYH